MSWKEEFPFESHYQDISGCRLHYLDVGEKEAPALIFLHGVPTWSYTFRRIIPACVKAGYRVVAPDLPGFGLSEKPIVKRLFTMKWLVQVIRDFIGIMNLEQPVLFAHDWGAIVGLLLASEKEERFSGMILCNGLLPLPGMKIPHLFRIWRLFARFSPLLPVGRIVDFGSKNRLSSIEREGYDFPFHSNGDKKAIRWMPQLLPIGKKHSEVQMLEDAWSGLERWMKPLLTIFGNGDPITRGGERILQKRIPGAKNQDHILLNGGHFLQEDAPEEISRVIIDFMKKKR
ncbi:MAG: haloalkane dehalogenase [Bacteroidota bacterium]